MPSLPVDVPRAPGAATRLRGLAAVVTPEAFAVALRWTPALAGLAYLGMLLAHVGSVLRDVYTSSDVVSAPVIAEALSSTAGHPRVVLGNIGAGWYTTLWLDQLTRWLPGHRQVWEAWPYALSVLGVAALAWAGWRLAGAWAATVTAAIAVSVAPLAMLFLAGQTLHGTTDVNACLLGALLVLLARSDDPARIAPPRLVLLIVAAVVTGLDAASDSLLFVVGLAPFALAPLAAAVVWRMRRTIRLAVVCVGVAAVAAVVSAITSAVVRDAGFVIGGQPARFVAESQVGHNVGVLFSALLELGDGRVFGEEVTLRTAAAMSCGLLALVATGLTLLGLRRLALRPPADEPRALYLLFWATSTALLLAAFVLSDVPVDINSARYLVPVVYAVAAAVPLLAGARHRRQLLVAAGASLFAVMSTLGINDAVARSTLRSEFTADLDPVISYLAQHGLSRGYASYWQANSLTWMSGLRVHSYPVFQGARCGQTDPAALCADTFNVVDTWFIPQPNTRTFLIEDPQALFITTPPSPTLGPPTDTFTSGHITVYIYPYDIATHITH